MLHSVYPEPFEKINTVVDEAIAHIPLQAIEHTPTYVKISYVARVSMCPRISL